MNDMKGRHLLPSVSIHGILYLCPTSAGAIDMRHIDQALASGSIHSNKDIGNNHKMAMGF